MQMSTFKCHKEFCQQVPNHLLLKSSLELCRRNDPCQGLLALGNPLRALLQQAHTGSAGNSKVRIENKLWSISDMLSPTLGRPPALPWWPDQPHPTGPTPSCAANMYSIASNSVTHLGVAKRGQGGHQLLHHLADQRHLNKMGPVGGRWEMVNFELYYSCTFLLRLARYQSASW